MMAYRTSPPSEDYVAVPVIAPHALSIEALGVYVRILDEYRLDHHVDVWSVAQSEFDDVETGLILDELRALGLVSVEEA